MQKHPTEAVLARAGLRATETRSSLLELLSRSKRPLSVKLLTEKLAACGTDRVTIYRTLETFMEKGVVRRVDRGTREAEYELVDEHDHHHLICLSCKKVSDFTGCDADNLIKKALRQTSDFSSVSHHSFDLYGTCRACATKQ